MTRRLRTGSGLAACLLAFLAVSAPAGPLDGLAFVGKNGEKGHELASEEDEEIIFQNGLFTSVSCAPYNFSSAEYSTAVIGKRIHFEAVTQSPTHGQIAWQGVVDGDTAEVTFVWTKERWYWDIRREYWFKGRLKAQKVAE